MAYKPPPNWPTPPQGWEPPPGWEPDPAWGPAPPGWDFGNKPRPFYKKKRVIIPAALLALVVIGPAFGGGDDKDADSNDTVAAASPSASATAAPSVDPVAQASASAAAAAKVQADADAKAKAAADAAAKKAADDKAAADKVAAEAAAQGTKSQQNAYRSAVQYLSFSSFSRAGLFQQLNSSAGEGYPAADAEFALARLEREGKVDYNAEAAEAAKQYLELSSFSRKGLLQQLTSKAGDGFTAAQAQYGVSQAGL